VHLPVEVSPEPTVPVALALDELDQALLLEQMQVALDSSRASGEPSSQGLHARPAQAALVVRVVREGAVGGDNLGGDPRQDQVVDLGMRVNLRFAATINLLEVSRRVRLGDVKIHQRGGVRPKTSPPLFYALFLKVLYLYLDLYASSACNVFQLRALPG
jgi:hypothetical protein